MHAEINQVNDLEALTLQKTDGNPFFIDMFLNILRTENLLVYNMDKGQWQWSISKIISMNSRQCGRPGDSKNKSFN